MKKAIVKVQSALGGELGKVLVYSEDHSLYWEEPPGKTARTVIKKYLKGRPKAFFFAHRREDGRLVIGEEAPWQDW